MPYVYSTSSSDVEYGIWKITPAGQANLRGERVVIRGGANVINKQLVTPKGVVTTITDEQLKICEADPAFVRHVKNGYLKVQKVKAASANKAAASLEAKDGSAQLTNADFVKPIQAGEIKDSDED